MPEEYENIDDLIAAMERDELEGATKMTPREYARLRRKTPQVMYYHLREKHIKKYRCECGRVVIDVAEADEYLGFTEKGDDDDQQD